MRFYPIKKILKNKTFVCPRCGEQEMAIRGSEDSFKREAFCYFCFYTISLRNLKNYGK